DILWRGQKLAGLLCERVHKADLVGLGLNVNADTKIPKSLRKQVASLSEISGKALDKTEVLVAVAQSLHRMISRRSEHPFAAVLRAYDRHHALIGRRITVAGVDGEPPVDGTCR